MTDRSLRGALISPDNRFRAELRAMLGDFEPRIGIALEVSERFVDFREDVVRHLRQSKLELLLVDLEQEPDLGVKFIQFLADAQPGHRVIAFGGDISPDLLLTAMRAGVADYLHKPVSPDLLRVAISRVAQTMGSRAKTAGEERADGQVYAFFSPKGGSGSTTVATNLAVVLRQLTGKKTLLVDLDLELGETALMLGMRPRFNFVDLVQNFHRMDADLLASFIERHDSGVDLLSAPVPSGEGGDGERRPDPPDPAVPAAALRLRRGGYVEVVLAVHAGGVRAGRPGVPGHHRGPALAPEHPAGAADDAAGAGPGRGPAPAGHQPVRPEGSDLGQGHRAQPGPEGVLEAEQRLRGGARLAQHRQAHRDERDLELQQGPEEPRRDAGGHRSPDRASRPASSAP